MAIPSIGDRHEGLACCKISVAACCGVNSCVFKNSYSTCLAFLSAVQFLLILFGHASFKNSRDCGTLRVRVFRPA